MDNRPLPDWGGGPAFHFESDAALPEGREPLSTRERGVLELLSKAFSTKSIARALDLSSGTVKWRLKNVYGKLNAVSREDSLARARVLRIIE